jgi:O-antigen/teichoic acid export membrane protein
LTVNDLCGDIDVIFQHIMNQIWVRFLPEFIRTKVEGRHYLQNVISNTGWLFFDNILRMGVGLVVGVWIARYLGPDRYGQLSYALAFVVLFSSLANLGLDSLVVRNIVRSPSTKDEILGTVFVLKLLGGAVAFGITMIAILLLRPADHLTHWLVGITAAGLVFQAFDSIDYWFQSQVRSKLTVIAKNIVFLFLSAVRIVLVITKAPLIAFAYAGLAETILGAMGLLAAYQVNGGYLKAWRATLGMAKELLRDSWPLIFSGIVSMIYLRIDQVMLGEIAGNKEVGIYSVAVRLAEVWYFIPTALYSSVLPSIVEARAISEGLFYDRLQKFYNMMALIGYAIAIPVTFMAGWIVELLFGQAYGRASAMLAVLIWAGLFVNLGVARSAFLMTMNWTRVHFVTVSLGAFINIVLNYVLIPRYGGMGAVIASCVAYWVAAHGSCYLYKPLVRTGNMITRAMIYPRIW